MPVLMKKTLAYAVASGLSAILWCMALHSCGGVPGAPNPPGRSQIGTSKVLTPTPSTFQFPKSQHKCFVQKWERAETNSWFGSSQITATKWVNAIDYSELENTVQSDNSHYVKYDHRNSRLFGCYDITCGACEAGIYNKILLCQNDKLSCFGYDSKNGTNVLRLIFVSITTQLVFTDRHAKSKFLTV
jgi:hypothetical protein